MFTLRSGGLRCPFTRRRYLRDVRVAVLDLGSTSFRLVVADWGPGSGLVPRLQSRKHLNLGMVVGRGMLLVAIGVAAGLAGAAGLTRLMAGLLYAVAPLDPATFVTVPLVLSTIALCACAIPAALAAIVSSIG